ncbi:hypothetical protein H0H81_003059, partial [Sphagnurus paluster]
YFMFIAAGNKVIMEDTPVSKTLEDSQAQYANDSYFSMFITAGDDIVMEDMLVSESVGVEDTKIRCSALVLAPFLASHPRP